MIDLTTELIKAIVIFSLWLMFVAVLADFTIELERL